MSNNPKKYLLDANVFIEAHRRYYSFDICPGFWDCLAHHNTQSVLYSIDKVRDELLDGDTLGNWVKHTLPGDMFYTTNDIAVADQFALIMQDVQLTDQYKPEAKSEFAQVADGWLIAYAKQYDHIVVTHEVFDPNVKKKVPIPNICRKYSVPYINTFEMLRNLNAQFNWENHVH